MHVPHTKFPLLFGILWMAAAPSFAATITNASLAVTIAEGRFTLQALGRPAPFAEGRLWQEGKIETAALRDEVLGEGQAIHVVAADGSGETFALFPDLPFALHRSVLVNRGAAAAVLNKVPGLVASITPGAPADRLVALGTGGLKPLAKNVGSYAWMAVADPATRAGVVGGWLTHERGSGVIFTGVDGDKVSLEARLEYGRLQLDPGQSTTSETFLLGWFGDARVGLETWAGVVAACLKIKLPPAPTVYCTWYDNAHGGAGSAKSMAELSAFAAKALKPYGLSCLQIDDGWQMGDPKGNGPRKNFSAYNPHGPYPEGMKATADNLRGDGFTAGLWILPFGGSWNDPFFEPHQDWFVKREDGKPFDTAWGGTALDMTQEGARDFVRSEVRQAVQDWGFHYLKLDGLSTGIGVKPQYVNDAWKEDNLGDGVFHDPARSHVEVFRNGLRMIRETAGTDTFILGCCAPQNMRSYAGVFGLVDAMRMGPDNGGSWKNWSHTSPDYGSRNYFLNGRIWWNDPDPIYVRTSIPLESARCIASWNGISGQMTSLSDWLPTLPEERLELIRRCIPAHGAEARPIDLFSAWPPRQWLVTDRHSTHPRRDVLGLFNWSTNAEEVSLDLAAAGLPKAEEYSVYDFWRRELLPPVKGGLKITVPAAGCRVLSVRARADHPVLLSTSRHVSQGMVELEAEAWSGEDRILSGASAVVGGDDYELRVIAGAPYANPVLEVSPEDLAAGVTVTPLSLSLELVRGSIKSQVNRLVRWRFRFPLSAGVPPASPAGAALPPTLGWPEEKIDQWNGFRRHTFQVDGCEAWVVEPREPLAGKPWSWCMEFPDAFVERCAAPQLLAKGFYHAHIRVGNTFGCPDAVRHFNAFYAAARSRGLGEKPALIGISRGGLYAYRWAAENPGKVSVIYGDAPVCDFKSWPGGKGKGAGSKSDWESLIRCYGFKDEAEALAYPGNPIDLLKPLAQAHVALIHVVGDADDVVPVAENTTLVEQRYQDLGGEVTVIHKPGIGHHPHGLPDPSPVVEFILKHAAVPTGGK